MASENVVLVHGGFVDGSGWQGVYGSPKRDGYGVGVVQHPTLSLEDDAAVTRRVVDAQGGPVVLGWTFLWRGRGDPGWGRDPHGGGRPHLGRLAGAAGGGG